MTDVLLVWMAYKPCVFNCISSPTQYMHCFA